MSETLQDRYDRALFEFRVSKEHLDDLTRQMAREYAEAEMADARAITEPEG